MLNDVINYYVNLLILQYNGKQKARDTIDLLAEAGVMDLLPLDIQNGFDLETAEGVQLDIIGKYIGVVRKIKTLSKVLDLTDLDFRTLIKIGLIKNYSQSSLFDIQQLIANFFAGTLIVFDFKNMRLGYFFDSAIGSRDLAEAIVVNNLLPKPMGVALSSTIYSNNISNFFGMITYTQTTIGGITGFNNYIDYKTDEPWLDYSDAIIV